MEGGDELGEGGRRRDEVASEELVVFPRQGAGLEPGELGQPVGQGAAVGEMQVVWTSVRVRGLLWEPGEMQVVWTSVRVRGLLWEPGEMQMMWTRAALRMARSA